LGHLKATAAVAALGANLTSEVSNLRKEVAAALGEIGDSAALAWLEPAQNDPDPDVRKLIQWAIGRCR
jgi:HEAT repeat protein